MELRDHLVEWDSVDNESLSREIEGWHFHVFIRISVDNTLIFYVNRNYYAIIGSDKKDRMESKRLARKCVNVCKRILKTSPIYIVCDPGICRNLQQIMEDVITVWRQYVNPKRVRRRINNMDVSSAFLEMKII